MFRSCSNSVWKLRQNPGKLSYLYLLFSNRVVFIPRGNMLDRIMSAIFCFKVSTQYSIWTAVETPQSKITASLPKTNGKFPTPHRMPSASAPSLFLVPLKAPALWHPENAELPHRKEQPSGSMGSLLALPVIPSPLILLKPVPSACLVSLPSSDSAGSTAVVTYFTSTYSFS